MKKNPYPYSAQIVAKTIKDWQHVDFNLIFQFARSDQAWERLETDYAIEPDYSLCYRNWDSDYLCHPYGFQDDISFDDKLKLGEKLIKPYIVWKTEQDEKKEKARLKKEKREHLKAIKDFLGE